MLELMNSNDTNKNPTQQQPRQPFVPPHFQFKPVSSIVVPNTSSSLNTAEGLDTLIAASSSLPLPESSSSPSLERKPSFRGAWTLEQDNALRAAVEHHGGRNWKQVAAQIPGEKNHVQCLQRWNKVIKPGLIKGPWKPTEDDILLSCMAEVETNNWVAVSEKVRGRTPKQCRERWLLCLDPHIRKEKWTLEEDHLLMQLHQEHGNSWAFLSKFFQGRTENSVKSRVKSLQKKFQNQLPPPPTPLQHVPLFNPVSMSSSNSPVDFTLSSWKHLPPSTTTSTITTATTTAAAATTDSNPPREDEFFYFPPPPYSSSSSTHTTTNSLFLEDPSPSSALQSMYEPDANSRNYSNNNAMMLRRFSLLSPLLPPPPPASATNMATAATTTTTFLDNPSGNNPLMMGFDFATLFSQ